ncbi:MAG: tagaturonate reductase [Clostridiales bacterium]|nr:tagaturonate reductase [Clostridiales bacterium]
MKKLKKKLLTGDFKFPEDVAIGSLDDMPERIIQFGEGNFLRAFVNWMVDEMNKQELFMGKTVVVQPIPQGQADTLNEQEGLYTLLLRGISEGEIVEKKSLVTSISRAINPYEDWQAYLSCAVQPEMRFMVSNTTEAGIAYKKEAKPVDNCPETFPSKVTAFLYERFNAFNGSPDKGMIIIPCELIDQNGDSLKDIVFRYIDDWDLGDKFKAWVDEHNYFLNTLVDRIVTGYPMDEAEKLKAELGYDDKLMVAGEVFHLWVIEGDESLANELPLVEAGLDVIWTDDLTPYRTRKVRILNGAHTMMVPMAYLYGIDTVRECIEDDTVLSYMKKGIYDEIIPVLDLPQEEKEAFATAVLERFANPFIEHQLLSIALNSVSKWQVRVLPSLLEYIELKDKLPQVLTFSLAALLAFYKGSELRDGALIGNRDNSQYNIQDDQNILDFFYKLWQDYEEDEDLHGLCTKALGQDSFWGMDLTTVEGLVQAVVNYLREILDKGMKAAVKDIL